VILADTSAWVEYDRATGTAADLRLHALITTDAELAVSEPVIAEVVAGARDDRREHDLRRLLTRCVLLRCDAAVDFDGAARIHRECRRAGVTPRGLLDCVIASVALRHGADVLAHDADLARIATVVPLSLDEASLRLS
jgi:predicted nucleic acid-binding protein